MVQVTQLSKNFNNYKALDNLSFKIERGKKFGLLGPNGAGKSTLINILSGVVSQDIGEIKINGLDQNTHRDELKKIIGVVPQEIALYDEFSAYQNLLFWAKLYQIDSKELKSRVNDVLAFIGLEDRKNEQIKNYSGGMKRRVNIAAAIIHKPEIIFFDEPTVGVDPQSRNKIFELIETLNDQGSTIIYTTHYMEEVERLCDQIAIIDQGKIIAQGTQAELRNSTNAKETMLLGFKSLSASQFSDLENQLDFPLLKKENSIRITGNIQSNISVILQTVTQMKLDINKMETTQVNLEQIFLELTGKTLRDK